MLEIWRVLLIWFCVLHWLHTGRCTPQVGYPADEEHNPHIDGFLIPDHGLHNARPDSTWPIDHNHEMLFSIRVDEELDMDLIETILAEHNGHPKWRNRVQFLNSLGASE